MTADKVAQIIVDFILAIRNPKSEIQSSTLGSSHWACPKQVGRRKW
ncbi:hypothetical protein [Scytonema sp. HK-05]|nr:hypothetical protein [Scytonema sp. HK-05]